MAAEIKFAEDWQNLLESSQEMWAKSDRLTNQLVGVAANLDG